MFTHITYHASVLVTAVVVLTGGAAARGAPAAADQNQDDRFLALLEQEQIPALQNVPSLIDTAHRVCRKLDGGTPVDSVVDDMRRNAYTVPGAAQSQTRRIMSTIARFITASVEAYCPADQGKIVSITANPVAGAKNPTPHVAGYRHGTVLTSLNRPVPAGEMTPDPPAIPPPPPTAQILAPPRPIAVPPPPQHQPPPQQFRPPPPQSPPSPPPAPAAGPQRGAGAGEGGMGGGGGVGPVEPSPAEPPGLVRLAP
ncbi:MAG: DUF732 domain-containing protein [Mycobacterium sp.]|nr:DUF732 domain-containing protein [Mycobacterium sp.]